jgi:hypothetical protein
MNRYSWFLLVMVVFASCGKVVDTDPRAVVSITLKGDFAGIDSVAGVLSEPGVSRPLSFKRSGDTLLTASIGNVENGADKKIKVELFDGMLLRFSGEEEFSVDNDDPLELTLDLLPVDRLIAPSSCWNANLVCNTDTAAGQYTLSWSSYPDSVEFKETLRLVYVVVADTNPIAEEWVYSPANIVDRRQFGDNSVSGPVPAEKTYIGLFLYSDRFRTYIMNCGYIPIK